VRWLPQSPHRLCDAFLIKESHIAACGSITQVGLLCGQLHLKKPIEVEVENLNEFAKVLDAGANIIMPDNFSVEDMRKAVEINNGQAKLEPSENLTENLTNNCKN